MIRAVIIDDEQSARAALQTIINEYCEGVNITGSAASAIEGLKLIQQESPDLVFLDVEMPMGSGFDLLEVSRERNFKVIFTTAHEQYALKAIKHNAFDYLLKPVDIDELLAAVKKVKLLITSEKERKEKNNYKIKLSGQRETLLIPPDEVVYIEADRRYSTVHVLSGEKHVVSRNIGQFEEELQPHGFSRIHKSYLVNLAHATGLKKEDGGYLEMQGKILLEISRHKKNGLKDLLNKR
jgi:two-component system, LytTR family, response regulator